MFVESKSKHSRTKGRNYGLLTSPLEILNKFRLERSTKYSSSAVEGPSTVFCTNSSLPNPILAESSPKYS